MSETRGKEVERPAGPREVRQDEVRQYATFYLDGIFFGVEAKRVQEVLRSQPMTPAPLAPPEVSGLINLRGQIVTALDLRRRLGLGPRAQAASPVSIVVRREDEAVSLQVDEIGDVLEADPQTWEPPPDNMPPQQREMVEGVYKMEDRLLVVLAADRVLAMDEELPLGAGDRSPGNDRGGMGRP